MTAVEANYDGLVGPTHNYGGLSAGNIASQTNVGSIAYPRAAVLQGLDKALALANAGLVQGVLPPHDRPDMGLLRRAGFAGSDAAVLEAAWRAAPELVIKAASASSMWAANAATVAPSVDAADGRVHLTPANLATMLHRAIEADQTRAALRAAFPDPETFAVHEPLPMHAAFSDEGAANHVRLCADHGAPGVHLFVYGREAFEASRLTAPARQSRLACEAVARAHALEPARTVFARQSAAAIEAGAFHNDVVGVGCRHVMLFHEQAFENTPEVLEEIRRAADGVFEPAFVSIAAEDLTLEEAVASYLFNSMLVDVPGADRLTLIAPNETRDHPRARAVCEALTAGNDPIGQVEYVNVRQSMANGGGPACLRLRVVLTPAELDRVNPAMLMTPERHAALTDWAERHYRESVAPEDVADPDLLTESRTALDELTGLLDLGADFYPFQRA